MEPLLTSLASQSPHNSRPLLDTKKKNTACFIHLPFPLTFLHCLPSFFSPLSTGKKIKKKSYQITYAWFRQAI